MGILGKIKAKQRPTLFGEGGDRGSRDLEKANDPPPAPVRPEPPESAIVDGRCSDLCGIRPERWISIDRGKYGDRDRVECRRCGRFIGYRLKGEKQ